MSMSNTVMHRREHSGKLYWYLAKNNIGTFIVLTRYLRVEWALKYPTECYIIDIISTNSFIRWLIQTILFKHEADFVFCVHIGTFRIFPGILQFTDQD